MVPSVSVQSILKKIKDFVSFLAELECEAIRQENARLQNIVDNQKYSVADIERINHEKNELQQTIKKLAKDLEIEQEQMWSEELKYARGKEAVSHTVFWVTPHHGRPY